MRRTFPVALILAAAFCGGTATAAEGRIPLLSLPGPPYIITAPGHYILTRDITGTSTQAVRIESGGVTLDLNGFTITGPAGFAEVAIRILPPAATSTRGITIRNGRILQGSQAVQAVSGTAASIRIEGLEVSGSLAGFVLMGEYVEILDCRIHDLSSLPGGGGSAIDVVARGGRILDNLIQNVPTAGMFIGGLRGGEIRRNVVRNFGSTTASIYGIGIFDMPLEPGNTGGAIIADNVVSGLPNGADDLGIYVNSPGNLIMGNNTFRNGSIGLAVSGPGNRVEGNVANENGSHGIWFPAVTGRNQLVRNQAQGNTGCGVRLSSGTTAGNIYRDNIMGANTGGNVCDGPWINAGGNYCDDVLCP